MKKRGKQVEVWVPYNAKIADLQENDTDKHTLDMQSSLSEDRIVVGAIVRAVRISGGGSFLVYPNEGTARQMNISAGDYSALFVPFAVDTSRLQWANSQANDDWDLYCYGYVVKQ